MPGLCVVFGSVRDVCPLETLQAAVPAAEVSGGEDWSEALVRWPDASVTLKRIAPDEAPFALQVESLSAVIVDLAAGKPLSPRQAEALARVRGARHVIGVSAASALPAGRLEAVDGLLRALATAQGGVVFRGNKLLDHELRVFLDPYSGGDPDAALLVQGSARKRKQRTTRAFAEQGLAALPDLPPLPGDEEAALRTPAAVARRAQALWAVVSLGSGAVDAVGARELLALRGVSDALTPAEEAFLADPEGDPDARARFAAQVESLWAFLWLLAKTPDLGPLDRPCSLETCVRLLRSVSGEDLEERARLRPLGEVLDAADAAYRGYGAVTLASLAGSPPPAGLLPDVLRGRHDAFSWSLGILGLPWDAQVAR